MLGEVALSNREGSESSGSKANLWMTHEPVKSLRPSPSFRILNVVHIYENKYVHIYTWMWFKKILIA